jgi:predicted nucleotidyltransferase
MSDQYGGVRKEIHEARKQFREFKDSPCVLVLYNVDDWEFRDWPYVLFGAMIGDVGFRIPFDVARCVLTKGDGKGAFLDGGKMLDPKHGTPQNKTISAIAVLSERTIPNPEFEAEYEKRLGETSRRTGSEPTIEDRLSVRMELYERHEVSLGRCPYVSVFESPFARLDLPSDAFRGDYDSRHRFNDRIGRIERVFAGGKLIESEAKSATNSDVLQRIERFKQGLVARFEPERIVLFGSHAYGYPEPGSDVDLLVVFSGDGDASARSLEIRKQLNPDFPLDLLTRSEGQIERRLKQNDWFMREIVDNGKSLYEARDQ